MYPVPPKPETQGRTEEYIGSWLTKSKRRQDIVSSDTQIAWPRQESASTRATFETEKRGTILKI